MQLGLRRCFARSLSLGLDHKERSDGITLRKEEVTFFMVHDRFSRVVRDFRVRRKWYTPTKETAHVRFH